MRRGVFNKDDRIVLQIFCLSVRNTDEQTKKLVFFTKEIGSSFFNSERHRGNSRTRPSPGPVRLRSQKAGEA